MREILRADETGIEDPITLLELVEKLQFQISMGNGNHKLCLDDNCGHYYFVNAELKTCEEDSEILELLVNDYPDSYDIPFSDVKQFDSIEKIYTYLKSYMTEDNKNCELFADYSSMMNTIQNVGSLEAEEYWGTDCGEMVEDKSQWIPYIGLSYSY
jgi:hypothetical protein